jgi:four helix bundle protein
MAIKSFRDLKVWRASMQLAEAIYPLVRQLPADEKFGLSLQMRKAGVSIPSNIAEGSGHGKNRVYVHHLRIARGSEAELETQLELLVRLKYARPEQVQPVLAQASEVGRMLNGLIRSLETYQSGL